MNHPLTVLLAEGPKNTGPDFGKASPVGLLVVVLLLIAVFFLVWSMNRHLKKARDHFAGAQGAVGEAKATVDGAGPAAKGDDTGPVAKADGAPATREPSGEPGG